MTLAKSVRCGICGRGLKLAAENSSSVVAIDFSLKLKGTMDLPLEISLEGWGVPKDAKVILLPEHLFTLNGVGYRIYLVCGRDKRKKDCFYQIFKLAPFFYGISQLVKFPPYKIFSYPSA